MAHLPSGSFMADSAWLVVTAVAFTLTRAAGCLASTFHSRASLATMQAELIHVHARLAHSARNLVLHLSRRWPWQPAWEQALQSRDGGSGLGLRLPRSRCGVALTQERGQSFGSAYG